MVNIFINGLNLKTGGGRSILNNYLKLLNKNKIKDNYIVLTPCKKEYDRYSSEFIEIIDIDSMYKKQILYPYVNSFILPKIIRGRNIDILLNFSDIPMPTNIKQVFLFDWAYAVYPESIVWKMMDFRSFLVKKTKNYFFKRYLGYIDVFLAQTMAMKTRLENIYNIHNIEIMPNAVSLENMESNHYFDFSLPEGKKLLYLTYYYRHKNLEVFIPLAKKIKKDDWDYKIIITIDESQNILAKKFLNKIREDNLSDIIINIGPVDMKEVPSLYKQCDALLMPTLLESFSGTYVEAMFHKIPIFTSNYDFAKAVCGNAAFYFEPFDSSNILKVLNEAFSNKDKISKKVDNGSNILNKMYTWDDVFNKYKLIIEKLINEIKDEK